MRLRLNQRLWCYRVLGLFAGVSVSIHPWRWILRRCLLPAAVLALLGGCTYNNPIIRDSILIQSPISQEKPQRFGVSTTGEAIGEAVKAAGYGNPVDLGAILDRLEKARAVLERMRNAAPKTND